jgi:hypothetical protein
VKLRCCSQAWLRSTVGAAQFDEDRPFFSSGETAAVVVAKTTIGFHAGVIYSNVADNTPHVLHLGWNNLLMHEWTLPDRCWATPETHPIRLRNVRARCRQIASKFKETGRMPYSLGDSSSRFHFDGTLLLGKESEGLTCATFVLAIFRSVGLELVDVATWPLRSAEDLVRVAKRGSDEVLTQRLEIQSSMGTQRVLANELLTALAGTPPVAFDYIRGHVEATNTLLQRGPSSPRTESFLRPESA